MPRIGTRKIYYLLEGEFKAIGIKVGRDKLFEILRKEQMLITKEKEIHTDDELKTLVKEVSESDKRIRNRPTGEAVGK